MIVLMNPPEVGDGRIGRLKDAWTGFARKHGETVMLCAGTPDNERRILDGVNRTNDRLILVRPSFIPAPGFFKELDYLRENGILVVLMRRQRMYFNPGESHPYKYIPANLDKSAMVFQLAGQDKFTLPPRVSDRWLHEKKHPAILRMDQKFMGDSECGASMRSDIGEIIPGIDKQSPVVKMGCFCVGGDLHYPKGTQMKLWDAAVEAMSIWGKLKNAM